MFISFVVFHDIQDISRIYIIRKLSNMYVYISQYQYIETSYPDWHSPCQVTLYENIILAFFE